MATPFNVLTAFGPSSGGLYSFSANSPLSVTTGATPTISIQVANASQAGYLTPTDWTHFNSKEAAIASGTLLQYWRGDKTFVNLDTSVVPENGNLYFTNARANAALGYTPENVANKDNGALSTSTTTYPTSGAAKTYIDASKPQIYYHYPVVAGVAENDIVMNATDVNTLVAPLTFKKATNGDVNYYMQVYGVAKNVSGGFADIWLGNGTVVPGFNFGVFIGVDYYLDGAVPGGLTWTPPTTGSSVNPIKVGRALDATHLILETIAQFVQEKGALYTSDGSYDITAPPGTNGQVPVYDSTAAAGIAAKAAVVATSPLVYTTATRSLTLSTVPVSSGGTGLTSTSQNFAFIGPTSGAGAPTWRALVAGDIPTLNQNTTGSAAKWTTARALAGNSVDGSAAVAFANKFIVQGTTDSGLSAAQFLGALGTGIVKNTTSTGILSIAVAGDFPTLNQNTSGSAASFTGSLVGDVTGTQGATAISAATVTGKALTGFVSGAGTITATDTILSAFNKINGNDLLKAPLASPTFTGTPSLPTGTTGVTQTAADSTTKLATTAFVTTADNLKAPLASPTFTGDVNSSTGNVLISTIGKGLQVKTGSNAKIGTSVLVGGTVTVANTSITANSRIFLTSQVDGGTVGSLRVSAKTVATSFVITSSSVLDTSTVAWMIVESIP